MGKIKKGSLVYRISHGKDILFVVDYMTHIDGRDIVLLKGVNARIQADSELEDLVLAEKN